MDRKDLPKIEVGDLNVVLHFGIIGKARMADYLRIREIIRGIPTAKIIYTTQSSEYLVMYKKSELTKEQLEKVALDGGKQPNE